MGVQTAKSPEPAAASPPEPADVRYGYGMKITGNNMTDRSLPVNKYRNLSAEPGRFFSKFPCQFICEQILSGEPASVQPFQVFFLTWRKTFDITIYLCYFLKPLL
jgi:hypothetical protein